MKRYFLLFGSLILLFFQGRAYAQDVEEDVYPKSTWSASFSNSYHYTLARSMHGDFAHYSSAIINKQTPDSYPLGGNDAYSSGFGMQFARRPASSPFGYYLGMFGVGFQTGHVSR